MRLLRALPSCDAVRLCGAALCSVLLLSLPATAVASSASAALQVAGSRAPYFIFAVKPGATVGGKLVVINVGGRPGGFTLYPTDATTGQTSGVVYRSVQQPRRDVGAWIHLATRRLTLAAGQSQIVSFQVVVPGGAPGGQHVGGIVAEPDKPYAALRGRPGRARFRVQVREEAVIAVEANLPGPRVRHLVITGIRPGGQSGYQALLVGLASTGTALTRGAGQITVRDAGGRTRVRRSFALDTFVPHTQIDYPVQVTGRALGVGRYLATITLTYDGRRVTRRLSFSIGARNLEQTFGSQHTDPAAAGQSTSLVLVVGGICGALAAVALGFVGGARRARRPMKS